jgi:SM-20-related protein
MFRLNPALDAAALARAYAQSGRVRIANFLAADGADRLREHLVGREDWHQIVNSGDKIFELDRGTRASMSEAQRKRFDEVVLAAARLDFQHRYEAIRVPDEEAARLASNDILAQFALFLSGGDARDLLRIVTGAPRIDFADAQATAYGPGDFLTAHDDDVVGKHRHAAYTFGLSPKWRAEWGGLLLFHGADGDIEQGLLPRFNTLNLFRVPQLHSVSIVSGSAPCPRFSITGWLRSKAVE